MIPTLLLFQNWPGKKFSRKPFPHLVNFIAFAKKCRRLVGPFHTVLDGDILNVTSDKISFVFLRNGNGFVSEMIVTPFPSSAKLQTLIWWLIWCMEDGPEKKRVVGNYGDLKSDFKLQFLFHGADGVLPNRGFFKPPMRSGDQK